MTEKQQRTVPLTAVDRVISWVSPAWGAQRAVWREFSASFRDGQDNRLSQSHERARGYRYGTNADRRDLSNARDRAYQRYRDNPIARALVQTETDNVIGDGLNFQPASSDEAWNREAKDRYYRWLETADVRGMLSGAELQRMLWERSRVAGDVGWIKVKAGPTGADSKIQIVPAENIATPDGMWNTPDLVDGIQFDRAGAPQTFYVLDCDERGRRKFEPVDARDMEFLAHLLEPNAARGATCYLTIFDLLEHLERYVDGVSLAAWMATVFGIIFKQQNSGKELSALERITNSQGVLQKAVTLENGLVKYVGTNDEVAQVQAQQPMQQTPAFINSMLRLIGQPFDMPIEVLAKDMSAATFATARIGLLGFYRACRIKAARFASRWGRTTEWFLDRERLRAPDDPKRWKNPFPPDYRTHEQLCNEWDYTDPVSEAQGDMLQIDMGTKSRSMVIAERGRDEQRITDENRRWKQNNSDLPAVHSTMTRDPGAPTISLNKL